MGLRPCWTGLLPLYRTFFRRTAQSEARKQTPEETPVASLHPRSKADGGRCPTETVDFQSDPQRFVAKGLGVSAQTSHHLVEAGRCVFAAEQHQVRDGKHVGRYISQAQRGAHPGGAAHFGRPNFECCDAPLARGCPAGQAENHGGVRGRGPNERSAGQIARSGLASYRWAVRCRGAGCHEQACLHFPALRGAFSGSRSPRRKRGGGGNEHGARPPEPANLTLQNAQRVEV